MSVRITQQVLWTAFGTNPDVRTTAFKLEALDTYTTDIRVTTMKVEALTQEKPNIRTTTFKVEVLTSATALVVESANTVMFVVAG